MRYIPHTAADITKMLDVIGKPDVAALFSHLPDRLVTKRPIDIAPLDEGTLLQHLGDIGSRSRPAVGYTQRDGAAISFLGAGLVPHTIPSAVDMLLQRSEWYTSYTPYQPEISQGTLQAIFEFQTTVSELYGLGVANASMYDGASGAAEAVLMAQRLTDRGGALIAESLHPQYRKTISTYLAAEAAGELTTIAFTQSGQLDLAKLQAALNSDVACVVVQTPNVLGVCEDVAAISAIVKAAGALLVVANTEPVAFGVCESPGASGADIAVGEGIGLAIPPSFGGPGVGLFAAKDEFVRQLPGRLVGETTDRDGHRGYVLTLATREQHIRREKATSNICTNQGLIALAFTIHMSLLGKSGFVELARLNLAKAEYAKSLIAKTPGYSLAFSGPTFNEFTVRAKNANAVIDKLVDRGIFAGVALTSDSMFDQSLQKPAAITDELFVVAVTERHSKADIETFVAALKEVQA